MSTFLVAAAGCRVTAISLGISRHGGHITPVKVCDQKEFDAPHARKERYSVSSCHNVLHHISPFLRHRIS